MREEGSRVIGIDVWPAQAPLDHFIQADSRDWRQVEDAVRRILEIGDVTGLVNNAAIQVTTPIADTRLAAWRETLDVNVTAAHQYTAGLSEALRRTHGAVVNISSIHADASTPLMAAYATSKGALLSYTRVAALELAPEVRVNAILPGAIATSMLTAGLSRRPDDGDPEEALRLLAARAPVQRVGDALDVAHAVSFLLDNRRAAFITGARLVVDGGVTVRLASE
jgi:NAD(P)-dependent dehydrogenase (short-subunit alcohol dehydrogenase family)